MDVERDCCSLVGIGAASVDPDGVGDPLLVHERDRVTVLVRQRAARVLLVLVVRPRVPEAEVDAVGVRRPRDRVLEVAEPPRAVAVRLVEADAGRAAGVLCPLDAGVLRVRRRSAKRRRSGGESARKEKAARETSPESHRGDHKPGTRTGSSG